jgi:hypothetical protein
MPAHYNFKPHQRGTTLLEKKFKIEELLTGSINLTGAIIRLQLKTSPKGPVEFEFNSPENHLTVTNALTGEFKLNKQIIDIPAFDYIYGLKIFFANGEVEEFLDGIWPITETNV